MTVSIDGTKILANASKHSAVSYGHCLEQMKLAGDQIAQLLQKAEDSDSTPQLQDGLSIPMEIVRREDRIERLRAAKQAMEDRAKERFAGDLAEHDAKMAARHQKERDTGKKPSGKPTKPPQEGPRNKDQFMSR